MKRFSNKYISLVLAILSIFMLACNSDEVGDDNTPPKIVGFSVGNQDTVYVNYPNNLFNIKMSDNDGLSSIFIRIDQQNESGGRLNEKGDSVYMVYQASFGSKDLFGKKEADLSGFISITSITDTITIDALRKDLPIITGDYKMVIKCMDMAGNRDSVFHDVKVYYFSNQASGE
ncbi:DUF4625 domain-containing protein [Dysgonomonas sp. 520]|uniref:DUF4625 domain-containing protein n=1 Tax=Dysgonomonas sp. 520 TaxID=2302931 RepID=UPI0013CFB421|nr:DUF4625 domain-containing protein [Dysgonomonas sp. 520]NDW09153.1 DUF4625 domain-containing protein [Dysgonomonas sp. 520]